jgi:hypothetical protein
MHERRNARVLDARRQKKPLMHGAKLVRSCLRTFVR